MSRETPTGRFEIIRDDDETIELNFFNADGTPYNLTGAEVTMIIEWEGGGRLQVNAILLDPAGGRAAVTIGRVDTIRPPVRTDASYRVTVLKDSKLKTWEHGIIDVLNRILKQ